MSNPHQEVSFRIVEAQAFGMMEALIIKHVEFWTAKNAVRQINMIGEISYTYTSYRRLNEMFPFVSHMRIFRAVQNLVDRGVLKLAQREGRGIQGGHSIMLSLSKEYAEERDRDCNDMLHRLSRFVTGVSQSVTAIREIDRKMTNRKMTISGRKPATAVFRPKKISK